MFYDRLCFLLKYFMGSKIEINNVDKKIIAPVNNSLSPFVSPLGNSLYSESTAKIMYKLPRPISKDANRAIVLFLRITSNDIKRMTASIK